MYFIVHQFRLQMAKEDCVSGQGRAFKNGNDAVIRSLIRFI